MADLRLDCDVSIALFAAPCYYSDMARYFLHKQVDGFINILKQ